jgi:hypothetical protein
MRKVSTIFLLSALTLGSALAGGTPDFSRYPQTEAFRFFISLQTNAAAQLSQSNLLAITAFVGSDRVALEYAVTQGGHETSCRWVYRQAVQNYQSKQLQIRSMRHLRLAVCELPSQSELPPIDRLVIVSYHGTNWITRSYDSKALPQAMRWIYHIIGEGAEATPNTALEPTPTAP